MLSLEPNIFVVGGWFCQAPFFKTFSQKVSVFDARYPDQAPTEAKDIPAGEQMAPPFPAL